MSFKKNNLLLIAPFLFLLSLSCTKKTKVSEDQTFRLLVSAPAVSKDPLHSLDRERGRLLSLVYEPLMTYTQEGELVPLLLEGYPTLSADQRTFSFKLRDNIFFHESKKFSGPRKVTSKDAVMSLLRGLVDSNGTNYGTLLIGLVSDLDNWVKDGSEGDFFSKSLPSSVEIKNELEFSIKLTKKDPDFLSILTLPAFSIVPHELLNGALLTEAVGSGPFVFESKAIDSRDWSLLRLEKQTKYTRVEVLESQKSSDLNKVDLAFLNPSWAGELSSLDPPVLKNFPEKTLLEANARRLEMLVFNLSDPTVKALGSEFRKSLFKVLDKESIVKVLNSGLTKGLWQFLPPGIEGAMEEVVTKPVDLEKEVKKLQKLLGKKTLNVLFPETAAFWVTELKASLEKIAAENFEFEAVPASAYFDRLGNGNFQLAPISWDGDWPEATNYLQFYYGSGENLEQNLSQYQSKEFDRLFERLSGLFPSEERKKLAHEAHAILFKDMPVFPLGFRREFYVLGPKAQGFKADSLSANALKDFLLLN